jgi:hypothetical protein
VVVVVAVGVGVMSGIKPVAGEVFPMPRRGEEGVDDGVEGRIGD